MAEPDARNTCGAIRCTTAAGARAIRLSRPCICAVSFSIVFYRVKPATVCMLARPRRRNFETCRHGCKPHVFDCLRAFERVTPLFPAFPSKSIFSFNYFYQ